MFALTDQDKGPGDIIAARVSVSDRARLQKIIDRADESEPERIEALTLAATNGRCDAANFYAGLKVCRRHLKSLIKTTSRSVVPREIANCLPSGEKANEKS